MQELRKIKGSISHVYHWKEMEDRSTLTMVKYNQLVQESGKNCESLHETLAGVKGQLQVRAQRTKASK